MSNFWKRPLFVVTFVLMALLTGCSASTTTASCSFVVGNGGDGRDTKLHKVVYPGQSVTVGQYETISYVPCNSRNYIINDGTVKNANGKVVGDRGKMIVATTNTGVTVNIAARALWTLNQSKEAMAAFYTVCFKYTCASDKDQGGFANFSTEGWNGMLAENFGPAMDNAARRAAIKVDDAIWQKHDPDQYKALADGMSAVFAEVMRANLGFNQDLFCGSGNSVWKDPNNPGTGEFTCSPVRIVVDDVQRGQSVADEGTQGAVSVNNQRLKNAQALYGNDAGYWLGLQDTIEKCKSVIVSCIINIGGTGGGPAIAVPNNIAPIPAPTPANR